MIYGCKILRPDNSTAWQTGRWRFFYEYGWNEVPFFGARIAIWSGVDGIHPPQADAVVRWFECDPDSEIEVASALRGIVHYHRVKMLRHRPQGVKVLAERIGDKIITRGYYSGSRRLHYRYQYRNGGKDGVQCEWYSNGQLMCETVFVNGKKHGPSMWWESDGRLIHEDSFRNGMENGICRFWDGEWKSAVYRNGKRIKP